MKEPERYELCQSQSGPSKRLWNPTNVSGRLHCRNTVKGAGCYVKVRARYRFDASFKEFHVNSIFWVRWAATICGSYFGDVLCSLFTFVVLLSFKSIPDFNLRGLAPEIFRFVQSFDAMWLTVSCDLSYWWLSTYALSSSLSRTFGWYWTNTNYFAAQIQQSFGGIRFLIVFCGARTIRIWLSRSCKLIRVRVRFRDHSNSAGFVHAAI